MAGSDDVLRGVITDGDVRRGLLKGETLQSPVAGIMNTKPVTLRAPASREDALAQMRRSAVRRVPYSTSRAASPGCTSWKATARRRVMAMRPGW